MHADLARRIATQHGTVLHEHDPRAESRRSNSGAHPRQTAAGHQQIRFQFMPVHDRIDGWMA